jgi:hypothetical protein
VLSFIIGVNSRIQTDHSVSHKRGCGISFFRTICSLGIIEAATSHSRLSRFLFSDVLVKHPRRNLGWVKLGPSRATAVPLQTALNPILFK